jgi:hypothetical protein
VDLETAELYMEKLGRVAPKTIILEKDLKNEDVQ